MSSYPGTAFHASLPLGRSDCRLFVRGNDLVGSLPTGAEVRLDLRQVTFERRKVDGGMLYFTARTADGPALTTKEAGILDDLAATRIPEIEVLLRTRGLTAGRRFLRKRLLPIGGLLLFIVGVPWFLLGPLASIVVGMIPRSVDREFGDAALDSVLGGLADGHVVKVDDEPIRRPVVKIVDRLTSVVDKDGFDFEVTVIDQPMVNAFALPGGKIVVTTGLLQQADSPEEVAGVLAHEISHVTERHCLRGIVKNLGLFMVVSALFGDMSSVTSAIMGEAANLTSLSFSRGMEADADEEAVHVLARAHVDGSGLHVFLEKMEKAEAAGHSAERWLSTHPVTSDRLGAIDEERDDVGAYAVQPLDLDWKGLKKALEEAR